MAEELCEHLKRLAECLRENGIYVPDDLTSVECTKCGHYNGAGSWFSDCETTVGSLYDYVGLSADAISPYDRLEKHYDQDYYDRSGEPKTQERK